MRLFGSVETKRYTYSKMKNKNIGVIVDVRAPASASKDIKT